MSADPIAESWPEGIARIVLDSVASTNAEAAARAATRQPAWILAAEQTGGRGRRGRPWASPRGNFYATLLSFPEGGAELAAQRSFVAALALRDACVALTGLPEAFALKWPNDVLLNGGKLAGILLESSGKGSGVSYLVTGIGVNLIAAPDVSMLEPGAVAPVSLLEETGKRVTPEAFLNLLAPACAYWENVLVRQGFAPLRAEWLAHATRLGEEIIARTGGISHSGRFETIDTDGALVLTTPAGRHTIAAADIFF